MISKIKFSSEENPSVSVVIPAKNEAEYIGLCLDSILTQDYGGHVEVLVIDNASTDETALIAKLKGAYVYSTEVVSPAAVRNFGASKAKYPILAFTDADCEVPNDWLKLTVKGLLEEDFVGASGGPCLSPLNGNWIVKSLAPTKRMEGKIRGSSLPGSNLVVPRKLFEDLNGFDESLITAEDDNFCSRIIQSGYKINNDKSCAVVHHGYPDSLTGVFKKAVWHGSTQIRAHGLVGDKLVILTWIWPNLFILSFLLYCFNSIILSTIIGFLFLIMPGLLAYFRLRARIDHNCLKALSSSYVITFFMLSGRVFGMIAELQALLRDRQPLLKRG